MLPSVYARQLTLLILVIYGSHQIVITQEVKQQKHFKVDTHLKVDNQKIQHQDKTIQHQVKTRHHQGNSVVGEELTREKSQPINVHRSHQLPKVYHVLFKFRSSRHVGRYKRNATIQSPALPSDKNVSVSTPVPPTNAFGLSPSVQLLLTLLAAFIGTTLIAVIAGKIWKKCKQRKNKKKTRRGVKDEEESETSSKRSRSDDESFKNKDKGKKSNKKDEIGDGTSVDIEHHQLKLPNEPVIGQVIPHGIMKVNDKTRQGALKSILSRKSMDGSSSIDPEMDGSSITSGSSRSQKSSGAGSSESSKSSSSSGTYSVDSSQSGFWFG